MMIIFLIMICLALGTVIAVESSGERWLVRFGDSTEKWATIRELRPLASSGGNDSPAMCVVCKFSRGGKRDEVITCDKCSRGYHPGCHNPPLSTWTKGNNLIPLSFFFMN